MNTVFFKGIASIGVSLIFFLVTIHPVFTGDLDDFEQEATKKKTHDNREDKGKDGGLGGLAAFFELLSLLSELIPDQEGVGHSNPDIASLYRTGTPYMEIIKPEQKVYPFLGFKLNKIKGKDSLSGLEINRPDADGSSRMDVFPDLPADKSDKPENLKSRKTVNISSKRDKPVKKKMDKKALPELHLFEHRAGEPALPVFETTWQVVTINSDIWGWEGSAEAGYGGFGFNLRHTELFEENPEDKLRIDTFMFSLRLHPDKTEILFSAGGVIMAGNSFHSGFGTGAAVNYYPVNFFGMSISQELWLFGINAVNLTARTDLGIIFTLPWVSFRTGFLGWYAGTEFLLGGYAGISLHF
jgi:hypothetical protein